MQIDRVPIHGMASLNARLARILPQIGLDVAEDDAIRRELKARAIHRTRPAALEQRLLLPAPPRQRPQPLHVAELARRVAHVAAGGRGVGVRVRVQPLQVVVEPVDGRLCKN